MHKLNRYIRNLPALLVPLLLYSCSGSTTGTQAAVTGKNLTASADEVEIKKIKQYTDEILQALARREFNRLMPIIVSDRPVNSTGELARRLLGPNAEQIIIERWDGRRIEVALGEKQLNAVARVDVQVKSRPNRRPQSVPCTFHYQRQSQKAPWRLVVP